jgi:uncharacterized oligopeptide transporter (OPT) family protein
MTTIKQKCSNVHHGGVDVVCGFLVDVVCGFLVDVVCGFLVDVVCGFLVDVVCGFVDVVAGVNRLGDEGMCEILMI